MRAAVETMYTGLCSVTEMQSVKNPTTGIVTQTQVSSFSVKASPAIALVVIAKV